jgi:hypothetical protein
VHELRCKYKVTELIKIAGIPRSTYYYRTKSQSKPDKYASIRPVISQIFADNKGRYGYRRITAELNKQGFIINHKTVQRLMKELNLYCYVRMKKYNSYRGEVGKVAPNLLNREFEAIKRAAETLCLSYKKEYDIDVVIVRPGHIYGPTMTNNDSRAFAQFARNVIEEKDIVMKSPGLQLRAYCYVFDCVSAILSALLNGVSGEAYNISNRDSIVTIRELAESFARSCGVDIVFENPNDVEALGYNMMSSSALDASKIEGLGWRGLYNIDEGVRYTIEILKNNL